MLAVAGGKGGVGKTTTALGLARAAAREGAAPLVVDADCDLPDLARVADVPEGGLRAVADGAPLDACIHEWEGVSLLTARPGTPPATLRRVLRRVGCLDRPVFVDCPAGAGRNAARPLRVATRTVLVTQSTVPAQRDAVKTAAMARALAAPVAGTVVRGEFHVSLLRCQTLTRLPCADSPLRTRDIHACYHDAWLSLTGQNV